MIEEKIKKSIEIIDTAFKMFNKMAILWTGGKDSTLMLWLVKKYCEENNRNIPKVAFINEGDVFEEIIEFVERIRNEWKLDFVEIKNEEILNRVKNIGDKIYVKELSEELRNEIKAFGYDKDYIIFEPDSPIGSHIMKTYPLKKFIKNNGIEAIFVGIRWDEHEARSNERYISFRENPPHYRIHPILHFTEKDVWETIHKYRIPYCKLYEKGYRSLGTKSGTKKLDDKPAWLQSGEERKGRAREKEEIMERLRKLGYF